MKVSPSRPGSPIASSFRLNRRALPRYAMVEREAFLHAPGRKLPCMIRNISGSGLMARLYEPVEADEPVQVELAGGRLIPGTILWTRDWEAGIAFSKPIDVDAVLAEQWSAEAGGDRRKIQRVEIECPATLKVKLRFYYGKICDLSPTGARVRTKKGLKTVGEAVLMLPDLPPLPAAIRWVEDRDCGLQFLEHIPAAALAGWLEERGRPASG